MGFQKNKSVEDALRVLTELAGERKPLGCRELARKLSMETTRVNRLLQTLKLCGFAAQDARQRYLSGPQTQILAAQCVHGSALLRGALKVIAGMKGCEYVVALGVLHKDKVCYLYHALPGMEIQEGIGRMDLYEASSSSIGMALLSKESDEALKELYESREPIPGFNPNFEKFMDAIWDARRKGYAVLPSVKLPDTLTIAACVGEPEMGAFAISDIPPKKLGPALDLLKTKAAAITKAIGETMDEVPE